MMDYYDVILNIINDTLDNRGLSTDYISRQMRMNRNTMIEFRNGDRIDKSLLFDVYDHLIPDKSQQDLLFLLENIKNLSLNKLKQIYKNSTIINEECQNLDPFQYNKFMTDVLRKIVVKTSIKQLRENKNEDNTLC